MAENSFEKYLKWEEEKQLSIIGVEMILTSKLHLFGGQCDIYALIDGEPTLIDLKTSKAIYPEMHTQVVAYAHLLKENNHPVKGIKILRIGRDDSEGFEEITVGKTEDHWDKFLHCLAIYNLNKKINRRN